MDKQALGMAIFMGLYVPLFTGFSIAINRWTRRTPQKSNKIIIVHHQFENQSFDDANRNLIFELDKSHTFPFYKDELEVNLLSFYKFLPRVYTRDNNLLQNFDSENFVIVESEVNLQNISQKHDS